MQAFEIKTTRSDYPYLVIADSFKKAVDILYKKGICDSNIISVQQLQSFKSDHILIEETITSKETIEKEVRRELKEKMPHWIPEPNGAAGGSELNKYLIRSSKGHYFTSSCIGGTNYYLVLDSLEELPGLPNEEE